MLVLGGDAPGRPVRGRTVSCGGGGEAACACARWREWLVQRARERVGDERARECSPHSGYGPPRALVAPCGGVLVRFRSGEGLRVTLACSPNGRIRFETAVVHAERALANAVACGCMRGECTAVTGADAMWSRGAVAGTPCGPVLEVWRRES